MRKRRYGVKTTALITFVAVMFSLMPANIYAADYGDIKGHWAEAQISSWIEKDLVLGYPDGAFRPDQEVTRAEFAAFIHRAFKLPEGEGPSAFPDVSGSDWYYEPVAAGVRAGLFSGYPDGAFKPNAPIVRQETAVTISRLLGLETPALEIPFTDREKIPEWALDAVTAVYAAGIAVGYPDRTFRPEQAVTRAESIVALGRALDVKVSQEQPEQPEQVAPAEKYRITFSAEARDASGKSIPAAGVAVQLFSDQERKNKIGDSFTTDSAGTAALELQNATYYFTAVLTGYAEQNGSFEVAGAAAAVTIDMGARKNASSGGSSSSSRATEVTVGAGGEAELAAALENKRIQTINITGEIFGDFTVSVAGQTINGEGSILSRNKLTGSLTVTAAGAEVKNLLVQGNLSVSGAGNSMSNLNVNGDVLLSGSTSDNTLEGLTIVGDYTDSGNGNTLKKSVVTSNSPGGNVVLNGTGADIQETKIKNKLTISGSGNSVIDGSAGSVEITGSENVLFRCSVSGEIHVTGNNNQIVDSPAKGGYSDSGQGNTHEYTAISFDLPETLYVSVNETKRIEPRVFFPSENYVISAASRDEAVATVSNSVYQNTASPGETEPDAAEAVYAAVYGQPQAGATASVAEAVYAAVYGVRSGVTYIDITVSADGYESVTKTVRVFVDVPVTGWVSGLEPISGASLTFYALDGSVICETGPVTTEQGAFFTVIKDLPPDFRVAARGGTNAVSGTPFTDVLIADYRNFDPDDDTIYINIGSSIVSACLDDTPGISPEEAEGNVKRFFELPEWIDLFREFEKFSEDGYFDYEAFLAEAEQNGGIEAYIKKLAQEMPSGDTQKLRLGNPIALSLGGSIAGAVAGKLVGWGLEEAGFGFEGKTAKALREIQNQLSDIKRDLKAMDDKMNHIYRELSRQITENGYDTRVGQLGGLTSAIRIIMEDLAVLVTMENAAPDVRENFRQDIIQRIRNNIIDSPYVINDQLMGAAGQESLLKVWSRVVKGRHKFLSSRDSQTIRDQFEYFNAMQACLMLLRVEYYNAMGAYASADNALEMYQDNIAAQSALLKEPVPDNMLIDRDQNIMIFEGWPMQVEVDGRRYDSKAPWHLKYWEAGEKVTEWNAANYAGYNNWRLFTRPEIEKLCTYRGSLAPRKYLESQGWISPMPEHMYFAAQYSSHRGRLIYEEAGINWGGADTEYFKYQVFELDNGVWHDQMTEYFIPGQPRSTFIYGKFYSTYTKGGRDSVFIPVYHWNIVRTMNADELSRYFW